MNRKTAQGHSNKANGTEPSCRNLVYPHSRAERWPSVHMSVTLLGNKLKEKTLLREECYVVDVVIYFKTLQYKQGEMCIQRSLSTLYRWLALEVPKC